MDSEVAEVVAEVSTVHNDLTTNDSELPLQESKPAQDTTSKDPPKLGAHDNAAAFIPRRTTRVAKQKSFEDLFPGVSSLFHRNYEHSGRRKSKLQLLTSDPNVFLVKDFLSRGELDWFEALCTEQSRMFRGSFTESDEDKRVCSAERTSTFIHLTKGFDATIRAIERRAADLIGIGSEYVEPLQIVSYTKGQQFKVHHDAGTLLDDSTVDLIFPRRIVTLFVYLNDLPEGQGHTSFPSLGVSVRPRAGYAVLFCNLLPSGEADCRTIHQACPVDGNLRKFGVNVWITDTNLQEFTLDKSKISAPKLKKKKIGCDEPPKDNST